MPFHPGLLPVFIPLFFRAGPDKELHFHLLEFPHPEDELPGYDLIAEGLADLGNPERDLHTAGLLYVEKVHENSLGGLRPQVDFAGFFGDAAQLGGEHEVEFPDIRPVGSAADGAFYFPVFYQLLQAAEIAGSQEAIHFRLEGVSLILIARLIQFLYSRLDQMVDAISLLTVFIIDHRITEPIDMATGFPGGRVHKNGGIDPYDILVQLRHALPPMILNIFLHLAAILTVIIYSAQPVIDLAGRENKPIFFTMRNDRLESTVIVCHSQQR